MIKSFKHKGIKVLYDTDSVKGINAAHASKLRKILFALDNAQTIDDLNVPSLRLHALRGNLNGYWAVSVSGNWRVIFRFDGQDVELVDYLDYH